MGNENYRPAHFDVCTRCGCVVADATAHERWHEVVGVALDIRAVAVRLADNTATLSALLAGQAEAAS